MHTRFIHLAIEQSKRSEMKSKHGAVLVKANRVIGFGHNQQRYNTQFPTGPILVHAEVAALHRSLKNKYREKAVSWV